MAKDVNFRIVEGAYNPNEYDTFIELYNQGITYEDIRNKMRIGSYKISKLRKETVANGDKTVTIEKYVEGVRTDKITLPQSKVKELIRACINDNVVLYSEIL